MGSSSSLDTRKTLLADVASWYCAIVILCLILLASIRESTLPAAAAADVDDGDDIMSIPATDDVGVVGRSRPPCDEIYVVGEGETLHTISDKCGDPFIVERNPHIHDPDDVFSGLVIKIISTNLYK